MGRRRRLRKVTKWTGVSACAVILAAWGVSEIYGIRMPVSDYTYLVSTDGCIRVTSWKMPRLLHDLPIGGPLDVGERTFGFEWPNFDRGPQVILVEIPYWLLILGSGMQTAMLFFFDRRRVLPGHCRECGYDLRSSTFGRCPECGLTAVAAGDA
ncbi:MAG: hypothetical protein IPK83_20150 [Planctomycetes bacterium]|nr:hypothetical protein [Planctomycetota bacterium]